MTIVSQHWKVKSLAEAMANLGSLLATIGAVDEGLVARDGSDPTGQDIELRVLVALRVLPRLPVALAADLCRLRAAPNPDSISSPATLCWPLRREMQGVSTGSSHGEEVEMWDALGDPHFTLHKPYLSEFAGLLLQFELLEHLQRNGKKVDSDLSSVLAQGFKEPWTVLLREIGVTSVSADPLRRFFKPLKSLFEDMAPVPDLEVSLPDLEESLVSSSIFLPITTTPDPSENATVEVMENSTLSSDAIQLGPTDEVPSTDISSTMFIALAGVVIGIVLVAASLFVVNRRRKSRQVRTRRKIYDPVVLTRHSVGRPASFSPVVAKRLSENEAPPPPLLSTFKETA
ncbi:hypothetical protein B566_EDAN007211 [Ephemera danica]|nr:hypothetical protein B566_EDAN007211 [Ephemera danica]